MTFKRKKYQLIKKAITTDMANFIYSYFTMKRRVTKKFLDERFISPFEEAWGSWTDLQIPNTYSHYADYNEEKPDNSSFLEKPLSNVPIHSLNK